MPVWWTKRSLPPSSGVTKPKPLSSLNHLTTPVAMMKNVLLRMCTAARRLLKRRRPAGARTLLAPGGCPACTSPTVPTLADAVRPGPRSGRRTAVRRGVDGPLQPPPRALGDPLELLQTPRLATSQVHPTPVEREPRRGMLGDEPQ